jgi:TPR repeat protein
LRRAVDQNDALAQDYLGFMYSTGRGVAKDDVQAVKWFRAAADQNLSRAQVNLGTAYVTGTGVPKNPARACYWLTLADADEKDVQSVRELICSTLEEAERRDVMSAVAEKRAAQGTHPPESNP